MAIYGSQHVVPTRRLRLPPSLAAAQRYLEAFDPSLRLRRSAETPHLYVLERRCRRRPAANTAMRDLSDIHVQARDGYIHVATVHPALLHRPHVIIAELVEQGRDTWAAGGFDKVFDEVQYEQAFMKETSRRRRIQHFRDVALEQFDLMARHGDADGRTGRTRISNVGLPAQA
jgi:hypothetical protein